MAQNHHFNVLFDDKKAMLLCKDIYLLSLLKAQ